VSSDTSPPATARVEPAAPGTKVGRLELFFDLVFVFAFLKVTETVAQGLTPAALLASFLSLALLWFVWSTFASLGNVIRIDQGIMPLISFVILATIFVIALALPEAFTDQPAGVRADLIVVAGYFLVRALEVVVAWYVLRTVRWRERWLGVAFPPLVVTALLFAAAVVPDRLEGGAAFAARTGLWALAILVAYLRGGLLRPKRLTIVSPDHWAERHGQIILVAFGESIISLGLGLQLRPTPAVEIILVAVLGIAVIAALWWRYFDSVAIGAERVLHRTHGAERTVLARNAYTYLHLPMIFGIILYSHGLKRLLDELVDPGARHEFHGLDLYVLYGGVILYSFTLWVFRLRTLRRTDWFPMAGIVLVAALIPVARLLPALAVLALLALVTVILELAQTFRVRHFRRHVRWQQLEEQRALEAEQAEWRRRHR